MTHAPDTRQRRFADQFALDGPSLEELALLGDIAEQAEQIAELNSALATAGTERTAARRQVRTLRADKAALATTVTGLRSELAESERQRRQLRAALAAVVEQVMSGALDPLAQALDVLEETGSGLLELVDVPRRLLAVAA